MESIHEIDLDISFNGVPPVVRVKQGDVFTSKIVISLHNDGIAYTVEDGVTVQFRCRKPDGNELIFSSEDVDADLGESIITINQDSTVEILLPSDVTEDYGICICDLCMLSNTLVLSSMPFVIEVVGSPRYWNNGGIY